MIEALRIEFDVRFAEGEFQGMGFPDDPNAEETFVMIDMVDDESSLGHHTDLEGIHRINGDDFPCKYQSLTVPADKVLNLFSLTSKGIDKYHSID